MGKVWGYKNPTVHDSGLSKDLGVIFDFYVNKTCFLVLTMLLVPEVSYSNQKQQPKIARSPRFTLNQTPL